jgi:acetyl esterase
VTGNRGEAIGQGWPTDASDLYRFMTTFEVPPGETPVSLLRRYDDLINEDGPQVQVETGVPVCEIDGWRVSADVYRPPGEPPWPTVVFFHGGAWTMGSPASHRRMTTEFAAAGFLTLSVDYPRAPKWRFPAAYEAASEAVRWAATDAGRWGGSGALALAGDSAGANLAAAVLTEKDRPEVSAAVLMYGIYDFHAALPLVTPMLGGAAAEDQLYVEPGEFDELRDDPRLSPLHHVSGFPPCWVGVGTGDPLFQQSAALVDALRVAGVDHEYVPADGAPHSHLQLPFLSDYAEWHASIHSFLRRHLAQDGADATTTGSPGSGPMGREPEARPNG